MKGDRPAIEKVEGGWSAEGNADLLLVEQETGADGLVSPDGEYVTLAGLLLNRFEHLPKKGETTREAGLLFEVQEVGRNKIERVLIKRVAEPADV